MAPAHGWHWRADEFAEMRRLSGDPLLSAVLPSFANYLGAKEAGRKDDAKEQLALALADFERLDRVRQQDLVCFLIREIALSRVFCPQPFLQLLLAFLREWASEGEVQSDHLLGIGLITGDFEYFRRALSSNPADILAAKSLGRAVVKDLQYATHEMPSGYLGDPTADLADARQTAKELHGSAGDSEIADLRARLEALSLLVQSWLDYQGSQPKPGGPEFVAWAIENGRPYAMAPVAKPG